MACPLITLSKVTLFAQQMAASFEQGKFREHGKREVTGFLKLKMATTSLAVSYEALVGVAFAICFDQVSVAEG
ncbi:hypothetical protein PMA3_26445 [Pseudomonas silesiensis]|uniref:Uncharacterized protein n=1 Tax=Pseudomonas silesiensis TaxID=1853130 RepID=A0A191Z0N3_9PSED|nr:hypothetical protein PMA3_26445 [Pseudomonas silesiensis]